MAEEEVTPLFRASKGELFETCWANAKEMMQREKYSNADVSRIQNITWLIVEKLRLPEKSIFHPMVAPVQLAYHPDLGHFTSVIAMSDTLHGLLYSDDETVSENVAGLIHKKTNNDIVKSDDEIELLYFMPYMLALPMDVNSLKIRWGRYLLTKGYLAERKLEIEKAKAEGW